MRLHFSRAVLLVVYYLLQISTTATSLKQGPRNLWPHVVDVSVPLLHVSAERTAAEKRENSSSTVQMVFYLIDETNQVISYSKIGIICPLAC